MSNNLAKSMNSFSPIEIFKSNRIENKFEEILGEKAKGFVTSAVQLLNNSKLLADCSSVTVYNAVMTSALLDLPINPNLGFAYIIPYRNHGNWEAQFQMGYKGFIQLCQRSGLFKTISMAPIYEGQVVTENPLEGFEFDFRVKSDKIIGYAGHFELLNGFKKTLYMTVEEVTAHAKRYSQAFKKDQPSGPWKDNFEIMAQKTVLKQLLSRYAPMTVDIQQAISMDQGIIVDAETGEVAYPDNESEDDQHTDMDLTEVSFTEEETETETENPSSTATKKTPNPGSQKQEQPAPSANDNANSGGKQASAFNL